MIILYDKDIVYRFRVVTKISSCLVNTTTRRGVKRLAISFGSNFLLFSNKSSRRKSPAPALNDNPAIVTKNCLAWLAWPRFDTEARGDWEMTYWFYAKNSFKFLRTFCVKKGILCHYSLTSAHYLLSFQVLCSFKVSAGSGAIWIARHAKKNQRTIAHKWPIGMYISQEEMTKFFRGLRLFEQRIHFTSRGGTPNVW